MHVIVLALLTALIAAPRPAWSSAAGVCLQGDPRLAAQWVRDSLFARDGGRLAAVVHAENGVRFSPSAFVDVDQDLVFTRRAAATFWSTTKTYRWGYAEGTGDPIDLTPAAYAARFVTALPLDTAASVIVDNAAQVGTTADNAAAVYESATRVDLVIDRGSAVDVGSQDVAILRLVLKPVGSCWRLVGIISVRWSP